MAGGWFDLSGLEGYQRAPRIVGKPQRPPAGSYKAALTNQPEGRRSSRGCTEDHRGQGARGYAEQCSLYLSLSLSSQFSCFIITTADETFTGNNTVDQGSN